MFTYDLGDGAELRILETRYAPEFLAFTEANRAYLGEWLGWATRIQTVEDARDFLKRGMTRFAEDGLPWVGIWQDGKLAGGILFFPVEWAIRATEIGYWLGQDATGRGLMSRALIPMLGFAFDTLQLNRVGLIADVENTRSRAVAERLGFTLEGIRRDGWIHGDKYVDVAVYAMLASDWRERTARQGS